MMRCGGGFRIMLCGLVCCTTTFGSAAPTQPSVFSSSRLSPLLNLLQTAAADSSNQLTTTAISRPWQSSVEDPPAPPLPPPDCSMQACVALTFDDGPNPQTTPQVLAALEKERVPATFFLVGTNVGPNVPLVQRMYEDGDEIGNHTWSHPYLTKLTDLQIAQQINDTQNAISATGVGPPQLFRPPYDDFNAQVLADIPLPVILWNIDSKDWSQGTPAQIVASVDAQAKAGAIIDLHDTKPETAAAAAQFIHDLKTKYRLVTVSQLLNLTPGSKGVFNGLFPPQP